MTAQPSNTNDPKVYLLVDVYFSDVSGVMSNRIERHMMELKGVYNLGDPPLSIPNREVKPQRADGTAFRWESRSMPN